jgi:ribosomal protein L16 Arg81 hydroxylase
MSGTLAELLRPVTPERFAAELWLQQPLHVPGTLAKLESLFGCSWEIDDLIELIRAAPPEPIRLSTFRGDPGAEGDRRDATVAAARASLDDGASIMVEGADALHPAFAAWKAQLQDQLQHLGQLTCILRISPRGEGIHPHFDSSSSIHVHLAGTKTWRLSETPFERAPAGFGVLEHDGTAVVDDGVAGPAPMPARVDRRRFRAVALRPGDVLMIPCGVWHETECTSDGPSASIAFGFHNVGFARLLERYLAARFAAEVEWAALPLAPRGDPDAAEDSAAFCAARLDEAIVALENLRDDPDALVATWRAAVADARIAARPRSR